MSVLEAFSAGTPVIAPNHGSFAAIVADDREGLHFEAGNVASLTKVLRRALESSETEWSVWSRHAREKHLNELNADSNYAQLMSIYERALETCAASSSGKPMKSRTRAIPMPASDLQHPHS